jgi:hypothetical protein
MHILMLSDMVLYLVMYPEVPVEFIRDIKVNVYV